MAKKCKFYVNRSHGVDFCATIKRASCPFALWELADEICKFYEPKPEEKWAVFAKESGYVLYDDVSRQMYGDNQNPDFKAIVPTIQISEPFDSKEEARVAATQPWIKNVTVKKI